MNEYDTECIFYVSPHGNDGNDGRFPETKNTNGPFATLERALDAVALKRTKNGEQPCFIRLLGGEYRPAETLRFTDAHNGLVMEPYGKQEAIISGGREITDIHETEVNGVKCWEADLEEVKNGEWEFTDLYVNGRRAKRTKYPDSGYLTMENVEYVLPESDSSRFDGSQGSRWFIAAEGDFKPFYNLGDCEVTLQHWWIDERIPVKAYNSQTRRVDLAFRTRFRIDCNDLGRNTCEDYFIENVFEQLKNPGEWYLDRLRGKLYYIPTVGQTFENTRIVAPVLTQFAKIQGSKGYSAHGIRFKNLTFAFSSGSLAPQDRCVGLHNAEGMPKEVFASSSQAAANIKGVITFENAAGCALEGCKLKNYGWYGVQIAEGCRNIHVCGCEFSGGGAGGVRIGGADADGPADRKTFGNIVSGNRIRQMGQRYQAACGILIQHSYENEISHNEICDLYYSGISCGWVWGYMPSVTHDNRIEKNHIHNIGQGKLSDMGGVYLLGEQSGTVVRGNLIHGVQCKRYGGWALYTDEGSSFITLEGNICYDTSSQSYHQHYGRMNVVKNNIFAFPGDQALAITKTGNAPSIIFEDNIIYTKGKAICRFTAEHFKSGTIGFRRNLVWDCEKAFPSFSRNFFGEDGEWTEGYEASLRDIEKYGLGEGTIVADPLFCSPEEGNFTLCDDSPAFQLGFSPIDLSDVGPVDGPTW